MTISERNHKKKGNLPSRGGSLPVSIKPLLSK